MKKILYIFVGLQLLMVAIGVVVSVDYYQRGQGVLDGFVEGYLMAGAIALFIGVMLGGGALIAKGLLE